MELPGRATLLVFRPYPAAAATIHTLTPQSLVLCPYRPIHTLTPQSLVLCSLLVVEGC